VCHYHHLGATTHIRVSVCSAGACVRPGQASGHMLPAKCDLASAARPASFCVIALHRAVVKRSPCGERGPCGGRVPRWSRFRLLSRRCIARRMAGSDGDAQAVIQELAAQLAAVKLNHEGAAWRQEFAVLECTAVR